MKKLVFLLCLPLWGYAMQQPEEAPMGQKEMLAAKRQLFKQEQERLEALIVENAPSVKEVDPNPNVKYFVLKNRLFPFNLSDDETLTATTFSELLKDATLPVIGVAVVFSGAGKFVHFYDLGEYQKYIRSKSKQDEEKGIENPANRQSIDTSFQIFINEKDKFFIPLSDKDPQLSDRFPGLLGLAKPRFVTASAINFAEHLLAFKQDNLDQQLNSLLLAQKLLESALQIPEVTPRGKARATKLLNETKNALKELADSNNFFYLQQAVKDSEQALKE